jgi:hypothetical protein
MNIFQSQRRSKRLYDKMVPHNTSSNAVFNVSELLIDIGNSCSWACLITLSHTNIRARTIVYGIIRRRIVSLLNPFIDELPDFFALMREINAGIVGSVTWNVMSIDKVKPRDLNIVVPCNSMYGIERLKSFLSSSGTAIDFDGEPTHDYDRCTTRFIKIIRDSVSFHYHNSIKSLTKSNVI